MNIANEYLRVVTINFTNYKGLADKAMAQLDEKDFHYKIDKESNSIAIIIQHMSGNARSRFTDFFTSDGEKPNRNRDTEFVDRKITKAQLLDLWEQGWNILFDLLYNMKEDDLLRQVHIRGEAHSALEALNRQVAHYSYHVGQIVMIAKHVREKDWKTLSIAKGKSEEFNKGMLKKS
jgi:hypothetical protein